MTYKPLRKSAMKFTRKKSPPKGRENKEGNFRLANAT